MSDTTYTLKITDRQSPYYGQVGRWKDKDADGLTLIRFPGGESEWFMQGEFVDTEKAGTSDKTNCLFCNGAGCTYCHPPRHPWFAAGSASKLQRENVKKGLHPLGARLATNGKTCGNCVHHRRLKMGNVYHKCDLNWTNGPATDIRVGWPACEKFVDDGGVPF